MRLFKEITGRAACCVVAVWSVTSVTLLRPSPVCCNETGPASDGRSVSLADVEKRIDGLPSVEAGRLRAIGAEAAVAASGAATNPVFEASAGFAQSKDDSASGAEWGVGLTLPFGWINGRKARSAAARADLSSKKADAAQLRLEELKNARILFYNLVYEQARTETLGELYEKSRALQKIAMQRVAKGEARPQEASRATVEAKTVEDELLSADAMRAMRSSQLCVWMGMAADCNLRANGNLDVLPEIPKAPGTAERETHPTLSAAAATIAARDADLKAEKRARSPEISVGAYFESELDRRGEGGELSVELPLLNWRRDAIRSADANLQAARADLLDRRTTYQLEAIEAHAACRDHIASAERYRDEILPPSSSAALVAEKSYALGEATLVEVIDAERTLLGTHLRFLSNLIAAQVACSRALAFASKEVR